jgi:hypothetical protein
VTLATGEELAARKLVLATGQDGTGEWWMPDFVRALPADRRAHTADVIDFGGCAAAPSPCWVRRLGDGQCRVRARARRQGDVFCRRAAPSMVQQYRWLTFSGFLKHMGDLPTNGAGGS